MPQTDPKFVPAASVPAFGNLAESLNKIKVDILCPMRDQILSTIKALEAERERLTQAKAARHLLETPIRPYSTSSQEGPGKASSGV